MRSPKPAAPANSAVSAIAAAAKDRQLRVATAESCTGGLLSAALTAAPGASSWFLGGITAYDNALKHQLLGVSQSILTTHGAVSEETARAMCDGLFALGASAAAAITGIAGPGGGTAEKPVGYVCFGFRIGDGESCSHAQQFSGERAAVRTAATAHALAIFAEILGDKASSLAT